MNSPRTVRESRVVMSQVMLPSDANPSGNVHGGVIMKLVDTAAGVSATRHLRQRNVTARIDSMSFLQPVFVGDLVTLKASVNDVGNTSLEVGVRVEAEDLMAGTVRHVSSAHLVFVALDETGKPCPVPPIIAETADEKRRMAQARARRARRQRGDEADRALRTNGIRAGLESWRAADPRLVLIGHRGTAEAAPENTLLAFQRAVAAGVDAIELDVRLSRDGVPVVIHDSTVDRTTDGHGRVADLTAAELGALNAAARVGDPAVTAGIPTLDEVLDWARGKTRVVVEVKGTQDPALVERTAEAVRRFSLIDDAMLISFDHVALRAARSCCPELRLGALYVGRPADPVALAAACGADALCPAWTSVAPEDVVAAQRAGLAVCVWTVNDPAEIAAALRAGVDAITSDVPARALMTARATR